MWHSKTSNKSVNVPRGDIAAAEWVDLGRACQLWVTARDAGAAAAAANVLHRFDGLKAADVDRIAAALKREVTRKQLGVTGRNWGGVRVRDGNIELVDEDGTIVAPIPLASVSQAAIPARGEIELQFFDDDTVEREDETLVEMRLYVPRGASIPGAAAALAAAGGKAKAKKEKGDADGEEGEGGEEDEDEDDAGPDAAAALHSLITDAAGIRGVTGESLVELSDDIGRFEVPRGRYAIEMYPTFMRLTGSSYEFKVAYKSIARMFYLPRPNPAARDERDISRYSFVISLDDPVRHGNQRHPHLVMHLERKHVEIPLRIPAEDVAAGKYEGLGADGADSISGDLPKTVATLFKHITGKPVFKPGAYESALKAKAVRCTLKSNDGLLYPLDKSFLFIHKPATYIRFGDVDSVEFRRYGDGAGARTWDLAVNVKAVAGEPAREYVFQGIDRAERDPLYKFLESRQLKLVEARAASGAAAAIDFSELDDEDEDEEAEAAPGGKGGKRKRAGDADEDEDEEDDDDYEGGSASDESGSDDEDAGGSESTWQWV